MKRALALLIAVACALAWQPAPTSFRFVLLGDRTGEAQPGIWERVWEEAAASKPAFVLTIGDTIQGLNDRTAEAEWKDVMAGLARYRAIPLYLAPGNHDIWSEASEELYRRYSKRATHYGFDYGNAHFTVLDNSRGDALSPAEMEFLESDLTAHDKAAAKFVVMHRPSWILDAALRNTAAPLHQSVKRHGVRWVLAGHVHQLIHAEFDGVTYFAAPSAGGHLRLSGKYDDGWFFGWTGVEVNGVDAAFTVHELGGKSTPLSAWGLSGLRPGTTAPAKPANN